MGGFKVEQPLPNFGMEHFDPFLLIHHADHVLPGGQRPQDAGVDPHPHRGFSPVTFIFKGDVHHRDSRGNSQIVGEGGMQWIDAGMGIIHSERPSKNLAEKGGEMEMIQLWVNSPKSSKMDQPEYHPVDVNQAATFGSESEGYRLYLYSGQYKDKKGPIAPNNNVTLMRADLHPGGKVLLDTAKNENLLLYQLSGLTEVNGRTVKEKQLIVFEREKGQVEIIAKESARLVYLSGQPLNEPVKTYGPYVMNSQTELLEAMRDYQMGKMGVLIEEFD